MYYTYMIRCFDNSIYTGMTNNVDKRISDHLTNKGAKYTKSHQPQKLEAVWRCKDKSLACKLEYQIKQLTKKQKEELIKGEKINKFLKGKIDCRRYYRLKKAFDISVNSFYSERNVKEKNLYKIFYETKGKGV